MKRNTIKKVNKGPSNPASREDRKEKAHKFIADCEASLIRLIDQEAKVPGRTWPQLYQILDDKVDQLLHTYKDHRGKIIIASSNVRKALHLILDTDLTKG